MASGEAMQEEKLHGSSQELVCKCLGSCSDGQSALLTKQLPRNGHFTIAL